MDEDVRRSRLRVSRRRALSLGGTVGLAGVLAACATTDTPAAPAASTTPAAPAASGAPVTAAGDADVAAMLDRASTCTLAREETQGPYWFDVDSVRSDLREDRPGAVLTLVVRVQDVTGCTAGQAGTPVPNAVVEIWHCDAGGVYSGFESGSAGGPGGGPPPGAGPGEAPPGGAPPGGAPGGPPPGGTAPAAGGAPGAGSGAVSDGSYSAGDSEAEATDDGTYLRGAQVADARGIVRFTTIYPGWYRGRTTHIHAKVHLDRRTVLTTQLYADDAYTDAVYATAPYSSHTGRDTTNADDSIFDEIGVMTVVPQPEGHLAVINLGVDV